MMTWGAREVGDGTSGGASAPAPFPDPPRLRGVLFSIDSHRCVSAAVASPNQPLLNAANVIRLRASHRRASAGCLAISLAPRAPSLALLTCCGRRCCSLRSEEAFPGIGLQLCSASGQLQWPLADLPLLHRISARGVHEAQAASALGSKKQSRADQVCSLLRNRVFTLKGRLAEHRRRQNGYSIGGTAAPKRPC